MLNSPARNATATESPVKISSVVSESVSPSERLNGVQAGSMSPGSPTANGYPSAPLNRTRYTSTGS